MDQPASAGPDYAPVTDIEVDAVLPTQRGFRLSGRGQDGTEYRVDITFDMPLDLNSRRVMGEMLTQSEVGVWRRRPTLSAPARARRVRPSSR
jgi:hypothetical protein